MTLLVGIYTKDGVVIAADRQATHGGLGLTTVGQPVTKIRLLASKKDPDHQALFAASGHNGLSQQLCASLDSVIGSFRGAPYLTSSISVQRQFRSILDPAFQTASHAAKVIGNGNASQEVICGSLLALQCSDGHHLIEISPQAQCERLTEELPFVCLGSGKQNADPLLRLFWSMFFADSIPTLTEATLAAYWVVQRVIDLKSPGVGFDTDVFVYEPQKGKKNFTGRQLAAEELQGHREFGDAVAQAVRSVRDSLKVSAATPVPDPPTIAAVAQAMPNRGTE